MRRTLALILTLAAPAAAEPPPLDPLPMADWVMGAMPCAEFDALIAARGPDRSDRQDLALALAFTWLDGLARGAGHADPDRFATTVMLTCTLRPDATLEQAAEAVLRQR